MRPGYKHVVMNRFPIKHGWDALSLARVLVNGDIYYGGDIGLAKRLKCIDFYFNTLGARRLHAALFRSGVLWSELGMRLAIDLANSGDGEYVYRKMLFYPRDGLAYRRLDWRVPLATDDAIFARHRGDGPAFGELLYFHSRLPYFRIRSAQLKNMKIVVLTRSILDAMESRFVKLARTHGVADTATNDAPGYDWDGSLTRAIEFFNSWGDVLTWHRSIMHVRFEDLKADEVGGHREILKFWGFDVPIDCIAEGFRRASKEEMNKRMTAEDQRINIRASDRGSGERGALTNERKRAIVTRLNRELIYDLGYTYTHDMTYGAAYD